MGSVLKWKWDVSRSLVTLTLTDPGLGLCWVAIKNTQHIYEVLQSLQIQAMPLIM